MEQQEANLPSRDFAYRKLNPLTKADSCQRKLLKPLTLLTNRYASQKTGLYLCYNKEKSRDMGAS